MENKDRIRQAAPSGRHQFNIDNHQSESCQVYPAGLKRKVFVFGVTRVLCLLPLFSGCGLQGGLLATVGPDYSQPKLPEAESWHAPQETGERIIAHDGDPTNLSRWWARFNDAALDQLLAAAQTQSSSIAKAKARIVEARAQLVSAGAAALPSLDTSLSASKSSFSFGGPVFTRTQYQIDVQSSWEIDLFGGLARQQESAFNQLGSRHASWHAARVSVAAEVANAYLAYRYCEIQVKFAGQQLESRQATERLSGIAAQYGLLSPLEVSLNQSGSAEEQNLFYQQHMQCEQSVKGMVALTGLAEAEIRRILSASAETQARLPIPPLLRIDALPARLLMQRPDVSGAERDLAEASANIGVEQAKRYPKLSITGNIAHAFQNISPSPLGFAQTWAIGPTISLPVFDAGKRAANVETAKAKYEAAAVQFHETVRTAVKEVEDALLRLDNVAQRLPQVQKAAEGYQKDLIAQQTLYQAGLASLLAVETSKRSTIAAEKNIAALEQEKVSALIALYRATGGSWDVETSQADSENAVGPKSN